MKIALKPEWEQFIQAQLDDGSYETAEQVIDEALQLLAAQNRQINERRLERRHHKIAVGAEQIAKGQVTDGEGIFASLSGKKQRPLRPEDKPQHPPTAQGESFKTDPLFDDMLTEIEAERRRDRKADFQQLDIAKGS